MVSSHATGFLDNSVHILRMESCDILEISIGDRAAMNYPWHPMATWEHLPQYQVLSHDSRVQRVWFTYLHAECIYSVLTKVPREPKFSKGISLCEIHGNLLRTMGIHGSVKLL